MRHYARSNDLASWDVFTNPVNWWSTSQAIESPVLDNVIRFEVRYEYSNTRCAGANQRYCHRGETGIRTRNGRAPSLYPDPTIQLPRAFHLRLTVMDRRYAPVRQPS